MTEDIKYEEKIIEKFKINLPADLNLEDIDYSFIHITHKYENRTEDLLLKN